MRALAEYLERTNTTQTAFAREIGVSQPTLSNIINGVHSTSTDVLKRIIKATGLSADKLLSDDTSPAAPGSNHAA